MDEETEPTAMGCHNIQIHCFETCPHRFYTVPNSDDNDVLISLTTQSAEAFRTKFASRHLPDAIQTISNSNTESFN